MIIEVEAVNVVPGRSGEKNGKAWSFRRQWVRGHFVNRDGGEYKRDVVVKIWNDDQPYPVGKYELVPSIGIDKYNELTLVGTDLVPMVNKLAAMS